MSGEKTAVELLKKDRIRIGAWTPTLHFDEEHIKAVAEAGIDYAILVVDGIKEEIRGDVFKWLAKYGIEACVHQESLKKYYNKAGYFNAEAADEVWFKDEPAFTYFLFVDEPGTEHFDVIGQEVERFEKMFPGKKAYVNLLPMYANSAQLTGGAWKAPIEYFETPTTDYQQYLDEYVQKVKTDYICVDIYPCHRKPDPSCPEMFPAEFVKTTYKDYVKNIEIVAKTCRETGRDFWCYIQTCSWSRSVRDPDEADLRWQIYTMLSFGVKNILYYTFAPNGAKTGCSFDVRGDKTKLYFASKRACNGLHKLSDVFVTYKNIGAFNVNSSPETTPYLEMHEPLKSFDTITYIQCNTPLLVGCFEKKEGKGTAFTLVNMQDMQNPETSVIKAKIDGDVTVYYDGVPEKRTPGVDGFYEFTLVQGDGVFVTVD
ncbi:MAG: hypothetical protein E7588_04790 [Ruminococcaceae bacterium]|nr:hypothetical protein [Oscillospiraceae bacterium]